MCYECKGCGKSAIPTCDSCKEVKQVPRNRAQCNKCKDIIESKSVHDFRSCKCGAIFVDGGREYWRAGGEPDAFIRLQDEDGVEMQKAKDQRDAEMIKACARCTVDWNLCVANENCPYLKELMAEPNSIEDEPEPWDGSHC